MFKLKFITLTLVKFVQSQAFWLKLKIIFILAAIMIGISNGMYDENDTITKYQPKIEQNEKDNL